MCLFLGRSVEGYFIAALLKDNQICSKTVLGSKFTQEAKIGSSN